VVSGDRLESWKEIAAYFHRSVRTVRRWEEKEGLPVHRMHHDKRGSVYASRRELDQWRVSRTQLLEAESPVSEPAPVRRRWRWAAAGVAGLVICAAVFWLLREPAQPVRHIPNPEAQRALERANLEANPGRIQNQTGMKYYQEAVRLDPLFGRAWVGLAATHQALPYFDEVPALRAMPLAKTEAQKALSLDPSLGAAWRVLGNISHYYEWNHVAAEQQYRKALELRPRDSVGASWFAEFLINMGRYKEAATLAARAEEFAPRRLEAMTVIGNVHLFSGNPDNAIGEYTRALEIEPGHGLSNHFLGRAYLAKRSYTEAVARLRKSNEILGQAPFSVGDLGYALAVSGQRAEAQTMLAALIKKREASYYPASPIAEIHLGLGNQEAALDWLDRAVEERTVGYYMPSVDPIYEPIRSHPRFRSVLERMHLPH
jgi:tetratricopeptide (TPR) repeat protein